MWKTRVCDVLGIEYPILEGGMSMAGNPELAAAVSNAGALGMLGFNPGWVPPDQREGNLRNCIRRVKELTNKPFGVNIPIYAMRDEAVRLVALALEEGVGIIASSGGNPSLFIHMIKEAGAKSIHVVSNVNQAQRAEQVGVDVVVAEGYEAGGANAPDELTTFVLVPCVVDSVNLPVVAAGGIADARGFVAALALGAEGIQMGTRFIATEECHAHPNYKKAIVDAQDRDTVVTRRTLGLRIRSLKNDFVNRLVEMDQRGAADEMRELIGPGRAREGQLLGDTENGEMSTGQVAGTIKEILTAAEVINGILNGTESVVNRCVGLYKAQ